MVQWTDINGTIIAIIDDESLIKSNLEIVTDEDDNSKIYTIRSKDYNGIHVNIQDFHVSGIDTINLLTMKSQYGLNTQVESEFFCNRYNQLIDTHENVISKRISRVTSIFYISISGNTQSENHVDICLCPSGLSVWHQFNINKEKR